MDIYIILFAIIVIIGHVFRKLTIPIPLLLVIAGMLLSLLPHFPKIILSPQLVLNVFLPILVYQISSFSSWQAVKKNLRPIALHSVGHVLFITILVAEIAHAMIPNLSWPLAFVLGAIVSPPDDVAIVAIAEKIRMPERVVTILEGEGLFNDAAALILFRFALVAVVTHQFYPTQALLQFFVLVVSEICYGVSMGYIIGELRLKIRNPMLHVIASILTPFIVYIPVAKLDGSGILATISAGFIVGNVYSTKFSSEFRLISRGLWPALAFAIQSLLFLWIGLDLQSILEDISSIPIHSLALYSTVIIATVIIGRFVWVYPATYIPRLLFPSIRKKEPKPPWQYIFVVAWAGMRGSISLAAALAIPALPAILDVQDPRALLIFIVFAVIMATLLLQGLTLPFVLKKIGIKKFGLHERYGEHVSELKTRLQLTNAVLHWLMKERKNIKDEKLIEEIKFHILEYGLIKSRLRERITNHKDDHFIHNEKIESQNETYLSSQIIDIEKTELLKLWRQGLISLTVRNKLLDRLDHQAKHLPK